MTKPIQNIHGFEAFEELTRGLQDVTAHLHLGNKQVSITDLERGVAGIVNDMTRYGAQRVTVSGFLSTPDGKSALLSIGYDPRILVGRERYHN